MHMMHSISFWLDASHSQLCRHPLFYLSLHHSVDEVVRGCQVHSAVLQPLCIFDHVRLVVSLSLSSSPYLHSFLFSYRSIPTFIIIIIISSFITHPSLSSFFSPVIHPLRLYSLLHTLASSLNGLAMLLSFIWIFSHFEAHWKPQRDSRLPNVLRDGSKTATSVRWTCGGWGGCDQGLDFWDHSKIMLYSLRCRV